MKSYSVLLGLVCVVSILLPACGGVSERAMAAGALAGDTAAGEALYTSNCVVCHAADGTGTERGPDLRDQSSAPAEELVQVMLDGPDAMPSYAELTDQELADIAAHVGTL